jgi:hypothetical protein
MLRFTLDTNCLIALENNETSAGAIRALADAHEAAKANVAVVAVSASERPAQAPIRNFEEFQRRLARLKLESLEIVLPLHYWDVCFWDWWIWGSDEMYAFERMIHEVLFPTTSYLWSDYAAANGLDPEIKTSDWHNRKCDVLALWSHIHAGRDVFVTNDGRFHKRTKKPALIGLGAGRIENAEGAVAFL